MAARVRSHFLLAALICGLLLILIPTAILAQKSTDLTMAFIRGGYYENIAAGDKATFLLEIRNNGTENIDNIILSATPAEWVVMTPKQISSLTPNNFMTINIVVSPPKDTPVDQYQIIFRADSDTIHQSISSTINIQAAKGFWWIIGGIVLALVIAGFVFVFLKYGRK